VRGAPRDCGSGRSDPIHLRGEEPTIQAGITAASDGDTVLVACDTYYEHNITMKSGVTLMSETGDPSCVTIDGQGNLGNVFHITSVSSCMISGFTIGGGAYVEGGVVQFAECDFQGNNGGENGGGIYGHDSVDLLCTNCTFATNGADYGGGILTDYPSSTPLDGCDFVGNVAIDGGGAYFMGAFGEGCGDCDTPVERATWDVIKARWR
jgi:predicted outer membrane repeat protein